MRDSNGLRLNITDIKSAAASAQSAADVLAVLDGTGDSDPVKARNTAWTMTHFSDAQLMMLMPEADRIISLILATDNQSLRRLLLNIIERMGRISGKAGKPLFGRDTLRSDFLDFCLEHTYLPDAPGIQSLCMKLSYSQCVLYPELLEEFRTTLLMMQEGYATSVMTLRRKYLKKLPHKA